MVQFTYKGVGFGTEESNLTVSLSSARTLERVNHLLDTSLTVFNGE